MLKITLITVGTLKEDYLRLAVGEYVKRLSAYCRFTEINIKEEKILHEERGGEVSAALSGEGDRILAALPAAAYKVALCVEGGQLSSEEFSVKLSEISLQKSEIVFIIGSSHGIDASVKAVCDLKLSVSKLTFPHQLMRVILLESIYRSLSISNGSKYHK